MDRSHCTYETDLFHKKVFTQVTSFSIISLSLGYLAFLFLLAYFIDKRVKRGKSILISPWVYSLSLGVYCTAWTYYGSVGKAVADGISFLTIYLGPILIMPLFWIIVRKMIRICRIQRITTLADFISARYGKSVLLSVMVSILAIIGIIPYISIQLKAISVSVGTLVEKNPLPQNPGLLSVFSDSTFYLTLLLAFFVILFAFRTPDTTEKHEGMIGAIAFESLVKLFAFLAVGLYITYFVFDGFSDVFTSVSQNQLMKFSSIDESGLEWTLLLLLSMSAILLLPRQFQVTISENSNEDHLKHAAWVFPAYLLLINLFVIPIALGGQIHLGNSIDPDSYVLAMPMYFGQEGLAIFTFLGGFSAATSMIIVSTTALSIMVSNNILVPLTLKKYHIREVINNFPLLTRRISVFGILLLAYLYYHFISQQYSLVSIGLISFAAIIQFLPAVLGALYWKEANRTGAIAGLTAGFTLWFFTLVVPTLVEVNFLSDRILTHGLFDLHYLNPHSLFGMELSPVAHGTFWALLFNTFFYLAGSIFGDQLAKERNMAELYADIYQLSDDHDDRILWKGSLVMQDLKELTQSLMGEERTDQAIRFFKSQYGNPVSKEGKVTPRFVNYIERLLSGVVGSTSSRLLISSVAREEEIELTDVLKILKESSEVSRLNKELQLKSFQLENRTEELEKANLRLKNLDLEKDEFISTVTHELRTPLTSIKAFVEILRDNHDISQEEQTRFLDTIINETDRMTRLINQVLDLEKLDSGAIKIDRTDIDLSHVLQESVESIFHLINQKQITLRTEGMDNKICIPGDRDRLKQVFINILSNAVKFSPEKQGEIVLSVYQSGRKIDIKCRDNGKGIESEDISRIFDKFYQVRDQARKKPKGSGLGLSISKRIIELHGGEISVISKINEGAEFLISLPEK